MSFRSLLAGPSRLAVRLPKSAPSVHIRAITIPHPDTLLPEGTTGSNQFVIRTMKKMPSMVHAFAIVRAVEKELGSSVISIDVSRDPDTLRPQFIIKIKTLRPVEFTKPILRSIPPPQIDPAQANTGLNGGPSLADVQRVLRTNASPIPATTNPNATASESTMDGDLQFKVEIDDEPMNFHLPRQRKSDHDVRAAKRRAERHESLLDTLETFEDERFRAIAEKWSWLRRDDPEYPGPAALKRGGGYTPGGRKSSREEEAVRVEDPKDLTKDPTIRQLERQEEHDLAREEKHHRYQEKHDHELEGGEAAETIIDKRRKAHFDHEQHVKAEIAALRKQKRLERQAERVKEVEIAEWEFVPGKYGSTVNREVPKPTSPAKGSSQARPQAFSLRALRSKAGGGSEPKPIDILAAESIASTEVATAEISEADQEAIRIQRAKEEEQQKQRQIAEGNKKKKLEERVKLLKQELAVKQAREDAERKREVGAVALDAAEPVPAQVADQSSRQQEAVSDTAGHAESQGKEDEKKKGFFGGLWG